MGRCLDIVVATTCRRGHGKEHEDRSSRVESQGDEGYQDRHRKQRLIRTAHEERRARGIVLEGFGVQRPATTRGQFPDY